MPRHPARTASTAATSPRWSSSRPSPAHAAPASTGSANRNPPARSAARPSSASAAPAPPTPAARSTGRGRPVFLLGGLTAGANLAAARYLGLRHRDLDRQFGEDRPFALVLRIVEPAAYGTDFTELVADVSEVAFQPAE